MTEAYADKEDAMLTIDRVELLERYPQLKDIREDHMEIVVMSIIGCGPTAIADHVGCSRTTVYAIQEKYKIGEIVSDAVEMQRLLLANSLGSVAIEAMTHLRKKIKELKDMSPTALLNFITSAVELADAIRPPERKKSKNTDKLIDDLRDAKT